MTTFMPLEHAEPTGRRPFWTESRDRVAEAGGQNDRYWIEEIDTTGLFNIPSWRPHDNAIRPVFKRSSQRPAPGQLCTSRSSTVRGLSVSTIETTECSRHSNRFGRATGTSHCYLDGLHGNVGYGSR